jgi:putative phosphonate metabolism protein
MREQMTGTAEARYAIYFAPPDESPLHAFGTTCLGRDAATGETRARPAIDGVSAERWCAMTSSPRGYGFHATLKPPFHLAGSRTRDELVRALERFAAARRVFEAPALCVDRIGTFVALVPQRHSAALSALADDCVRGFDDFRAPPSAEERARRRSSESLTPRQRALLDTWGYPYVMEEWRFHMTLATGLSRAEAEHLRLVLGRLAAPACAAPVRVDGVCLFEQPRRDAAFRLTGRFAFGSSSA